MPIDVLLLTSGGIDSTALLDFYLRRKVNLHCVHFQYGQSNAESERVALENVTRHYGLAAKVITLDWSMARRRSEILCRNSLFVLAAASLGFVPAEISLGIHSDSPYYDCSQQFVMDSQRLLDGYFSGSVRLETPLIEFTKSDIVIYCKQNDVPVDLTYSCQIQNNPPCGSCQSCIDRRLLVGT